MMLGEEPELHRIDSVAVKGRREEVVIYAPLTVEEDALDRHAS
jgi:hypothetical protein